MFAAAVLSSTFPHPPPGAWLPAVAGGTLVLASLALFYLASARRGRPAPTREANREAAEESLRAFADTLDSLVWMAGPTGAPYFYNKYYLQYFGIPPGLFRPRDWEGFLHPAERPALIERWADCLARETPIEIDVRFREHATGEFRLFRVKMEPMRGPDGQLERWYGSAAEVPAARQFARLIQAEKKKMATILSASPAAMGLFSGPDARCEFANDEFRRIFGWGEIIGRPLVDLLCEGRHSPLSRAFAEARATGAPFFREEAKLTVGGYEGTGQQRYYTVALTNCPATETSPEQTALYLVDISEAREARRRLVAAEERFRRLFSSNLVGMYFWNVHGEITDANEAFLALTGWGAGDLRNLRLESLTPPEHRREDFRSAEEMSTASLATPYEKEIFRQDGGRLPVLAGSAWISRSRGEGVSFVLDLTAQKRADNERMLSLSHAESARESSRLKSQFIANMSHEIRTPLHAVLGFSRLLNQSPLDEDQRSYLRGIEASGENLLRLVNDILDLAKIESRRISFNAEEIDFVRALREAVEMVKAAYPQAVPIQVAGPALVSALPVRADRVRLSQLLTNIVGNAAKFTPHGRIDVRWHAERLDGHALVTVVVKDTGIGIPAASLARLFQPFEQANTGHARPFAGTGLGLWISRSLAQLMEGDVTLTSEEGRGSVATITLRLPTGAEITAAPPAARLAPPDIFFGAPRVLVAEDNPMNQTIARKLLERVGCRVTIVENGRETLARVADDRFDLLLLDCQMPDIDGYAVARRIREEEIVSGRPRLPILAVTADAAPGTRGRCREAGMDDYLAKPLDYALFLEKLEERLGAFLTDPPPPAPFFDEGTLEKLRAIDGEGRLAAEVIEAFFAAMPSRLERVEELEKAGDAPNLARELHGLKACFGSVGLKALAALCANAEEKLRAAPAETPELSSVKKDYPEAARRLRAWRETYAPAGSEAAPRLGGTEAPTPRN